jgi:hypothetical protein
LPHGAARALLAFHHRTDELTAQFLAEVARQGMVVTDLTTDGMAAWDASGGGRARFYVDSDDLARARLLELRLLTDPAATTAAAAAATR